MIKQLTTRSRELTRRRTVNDPSRVGGAVAKSKFEIPIHLHLSRLLAQAQHLCSVSK